MIPPEWEAAIRRAAETALTMPDGIVQADLFGPLRSMLLVSDLAMIERLASEQDWPERIDLPAVDLPGGRTVYGLVLVDDEPLGTWADIVAWLSGGEISGARR